jgi:UDP-glucose 4-epimerase
MRIVIVGASGNIGTALLRALSARHPEWEFVGVSRRRPPRVGPYAAAAWRTIDVAAPEAAERLQDALQGVDAAVNLAWAFQPTRDAVHFQRVGVGWQP